jgi:hypothetical protein
MLNIITVKTGDRYSADYVNKMFSMLLRNLKLPFAFYCLTENPKGLDLDINLIHPPEVLHGWWNKLWLFSDIMPDGPLLYLDLDQIILSDITDIVEECLKHPFSCYSDHIEWLECKLGTAFMTFESGAHRDIFKAFWPKRYELANFSGGDQVWISQTGLLPEVYYFNEEWPEAVKSYKFDILPTGKDPGPDVKIVNFHGRPKMADLRINWLLNNWR